MAGEAPALTTAKLYPGGNARLRMFSLVYFTCFISLWVLTGQVILGFEQAWIQPLVAAGSACLAQIAFDAIDAAATGREPRILCGSASAAGLLMPAWISGMAIGMLMWPNDLLMPLVFASTLAMASKVIFRAPLAGGSQHVYNPSNFGLTVTLFLCPWVSIAPPYHFTENLVGIWNWVVPGVILASGVTVHALCTGRLPLVCAWLATFVCQALARHLLTGASLAATLAPMTSAAFVLFTLYMIPDPATTPIDKYRQIAFGVAVAAVYAVILVSHQVYGLFGALFVVSTLRAAALYIGAWIGSKAEKPHLPESG